MRLWVEIKVKRRKLDDLKALSSIANTEFAASQGQVLGKLLPVTHKGKEESVCLGRREKIKTPVSLSACSYTCFSLAELEYTFLPCHLLLFLAIVPCASTFVVTFLLL